MRDKRKIFFCLICLIIIVICERFLYIKAKKEDTEYKKVLKAKLSEVVEELELRNFTSKKNYKKGKLQYERNKAEYDYGFISLGYDIDGEINNIDITLEYSDNLYIDDIFYDAYYIFNLLGINIDNEYNFDTDLADNFSVSDEFILNNSKYNLSITKQDDNKIQFEIK